MPIDDVKPALGDVERMGDYNVKSGFPIEAIYCEFEPKDARWLRDFYGFCAKKLKLNNFSVLDRHLVSELRYHPRTYLANLKKKDQRGAPSLLVLFYLCDGANYDFKEVHKRIKNMRLRGLPTLINNISMKIIAVLLKEPGLMANQIRDRINARFKDKISERVKGTNYVISNCRQLARMNYLTKRKRRVHAYWYIQGQEQE